MTARADSTSGSSGMGGPPVRRAVPMATTGCHRMTLSAARTTKWPGGHPRKQAAAWQAGHQP
jgi:hypothetical protein